MAFEEVNNGDFRTYLTKFGMKKLLNNDLNIKYFSLSDAGVNYAEDVDSSVLVKSVTGDELKTFYNASANLRLITDSSAIAEESAGVEISKREIVFVDECDGTEYKNIDATIYLGNYLQSLRETEADIEGVSNTYEPFIRLFDSVKLYEYTENAFGEFQLWDTRNQNVYYEFNSAEDYNNYVIFDNTQVIKGDRARVSYDSNKFKTPFKVSFSSLRSENGVVTQNGPGLIKLYPVTTFGYLVDGSFRRPEQLTETEYQSSTNITPTIKFNNIDHKIKTDTTTVYKSSVNREIFRYNRLLESGITAAKNMFEFYGKDATDGSKVLTINMSVNTDTSESVKARNAKIRLNLTLDLDESNWVATNDFIKIS